MKAIKRVAHAALLVAVTAAGLAWIAPAPVEAVTGVTTVNPEIDWLVFNLATILPACPDDESINCTEAGNGVFLANLTLGDEAWFVSVSEAEKLQRIEHFRASGETNP